VSVPARTGAWLLALGLLMARGGAQAAPAPGLAAPDAVALYRNASLIDGTGAPPRRGVSILVKGERIMEIGPTLEAPHGARVVDATGLYVLPGLVNTHEHLATPPDRGFAEAELRKDLYGGVTTVRDMADDLRALADIARAALVGEIPAPDIQYAALMAGPEFFKDPRTHATTQGAVAGAVPWMQAVTPGTDLVLAVAEAKGTGAAAIKIYADLTGREVAAITREAHRQGMLVWAHAAVFPASPAEVVDAGVDSVSHVCMLAYQASGAMPRAYHDRAPVEARKFAAGPDPAVEAVMQDIKRRGTILDATLRVYAEMASEHAAHPNGAAPYCTTGLAGRLAGEAYRDGVLISAGTDSFSAPDDPWPALQDELELLQDKAGMKPADVIRSATLVGAMTLHRQGEIGSIAPGKLANLVFTRQDPSRDVHALRTVVLTVKRGVRYWRRDYHRSAAELAAERREQ
jgi:imidazolonepropionase-like amidohydrolase